RLGPPLLRIDRRDRVGKGVLVLNDGRNTGEIVERTRDVQPLLVNRVAYPESQPRISKDRGRRLGECSVSVQRYASRRREEQGGRATYTRERSDVLEVRSRLVMHVIQAGDPLKILFCRRLELELIRPAPAAAVQELGVRQDSRADRLGDGRRNDVKLVARIRMREKVRDYEPVEVVLDPQ